MTGGYAEGFRGWQGQTAAFIAQEARDEWGTHARTCQWINYRVQIDDDVYSVLRACIGLVEAARRAGINPATPAAIVSVKIAIVNTVASMPVAS